MVLMLANLAPHKGQATAIRAVQILKRRGIPVDCWLVGERRTDVGSYEAELRQLCSALGVQDIVQFLGFRRDGPDLLRAADVFLLPSTHEGLPLSVLEAQAAHVPVIGAPIPGILEVVEDGMTGFVVPADRSRRIRRPNSAALRARGYSWTDIVESARRGPGGARLRLDDL